MMTTDLSETGLGGPAQKATVGLICYQEKQGLARILLDLKKQSARERIGEVLLAQNGDCSETLKTAKSFLNQLPLKIFSHPVNNLGAARAFVVKKAKYPLIAWTDSDCQLPPFWLESLLSHWRFCGGGDHLAGLGGPNRLPEDFYWRRMMNLSLSHPLGHGWSPQAWIPPHKTEVSHIPTTNGLFSREKILQAGNFSERNQLRGEDFGLGRSLRKTGKLLLFPEPAVINHHSLSYWENLKRLFAFGQSRNQQKDLVFWLALLFFPLFLVFFAAGLAVFLPSVFFGGSAENKISPLLIGMKNSALSLIYLSYPALLFAASWQVCRRDKNLRGLALPVFWAAQHLAYSAGVFWGTAKKTAEQALSKTKT